MRTIATLRLPGFKSKVQTECSNRCEIDVGDELLFTLVMKKNNLKFILFVVWVFLIAGCKDESDGEPAGGDSDSSSDSKMPDSVDSETGAPFDVTLLSECGQLFGVPNEQTGLDEPQCAPSCDCNGTLFSAVSATEAQLAALRARVLLNPPELLAANPYETPDGFLGDATKVCAVLDDAVDSNGYRLETYDSIDAAVAAGATVTHYGACGQCSSLTDLAVYMGTSDLTTPVRACGVQGMTAGEAANIDCLSALGFSDACAQIWYYNTLNTRTLCLSVCAAALNDNYHTPDGHINECLQCDEDNSGPVFKAVSGRTRRNSGLPTAICRPCETVAPLIHEYLQ